jgi:hypothetical protein
LGVLQSISEGIALSAGADRRALTRVVHHTIPASSRQTLVLTPRLISIRDVVIVLGEFEYFILTAAARLGNSAYGAGVRQEIEAATGSACSIGAFYTTLDRLEQKGFIKLRHGWAIPRLNGAAGPSQWFA